MSTDDQPPPHPPIERAEYAKRLETLGEILGNISRHADVQARMRCPYKNRFNQCTAGFGCRYKRKGKTPDDPPVCTSDDRLDYRSAWETGAEPAGDLTARPPVPAAGSVHCQGRETQAVAGQTLFDHCDTLRVRLPTSCGRTGSCHECIVEVREGAAALSPRTDPEGFLSGDHRLACQAIVEHGDARITFGPLQRASRILTTQTHRPVKLDPAVTRGGDRVLYDGEQVDAYRGGIYGLSVDVGTTTVVAELCDLESGRSVGLAAFDNPQRFGGSDVMHRISYDGGPHRGELQRAVVNALSARVAELCAQTGVDREWIYEVVVVGNTTMRELFFRQDVQSIGERPYKSEVETAYRAGRRTSTALSVDLRPLGMRLNRAARAYGVPIIASHVGADTSADLVAIDMMSADQPVMLVDVGTNTEVVIGHKDRLIAASCPAGPAFEGGNIRNGMPGYEGAIESVRYRDGRFECKVIGDATPLGICGSGLIALLAELRRHDRMTPKGVFADKAMEFPIVPECGITFSRSDASELAQAKAANYCGQFILMRTFGVRPDEIANLYLAGGFANYVDVPSAVEIGFLAPVPVERVVKVGNAAAQGARELLLSRGKRAAVEALVEKIEHVELETTPDFFDCFVEGCQFKPMPSPL